MIIKEVEIYTESRSSSYTDLLGGKRRGYAVPQRIKTDAWSFYSNSMYNYYYTNMYVLERKRGCKPVYLILFSASKKDIVKKLSRADAAWRFYSRTVRNSRFRMFQEWNYDKESLGIKHK